MQIKIRSIGGGDVVKKLLLLCMAFVLLALVGGCGTERADEGHGKQLVFGSKNYDQINPLLNEYGVIEQVLFDGLMRRDVTGATVPGLAESYEYDPETYTYVFRLRDGVSWHDGKPLRAADVKFTIEAIRDSLTDSLNKQNFEDVREITSSMTRLCASACPRRIQPFSTIWCSRSCPHISWRGGI